MRSMLTSKWTKAGVFLLSLGPIGHLVWKGFRAELTANPIEHITHQTGDWTLIFLTLTLAVTPARKLLRMPALIRFRRMLGLFAFFYACLHFSVFFLFDHFFNVAAMLEDVAERKYITAGFFGLVLLVPLAITSTKGWIRRLGGKRWHRLHQAIYLTAIAGVIHFFWLVKSDITRPTQYAIPIILLLGYRVAAWFGGRQARAQPVGSPSPSRST